MAKHRSIFMIVAVDIVAVVLLVLAALVAPVPGPGGLPLLILGLGLLASNHAWAERILARAKTGGLQLSATFFEGHPLVKLGVDLLGVACIALAAYAATALTGVRRTAAISLVCFALFLLLGNRSRLKRLRERIWR